MASPFSMTAGIDGTRRLDLLNNFASLIHGHAHPAIVAAIQEQVTKGNRRHAQHRLSAVLATSSFDPCCSFRSWTIRIRSLLRGEGRMKSGLRTACINCALAVFCLGGTFAANFIQAEVSYLSVRLQPAPGPAFDAKTASLSSNGPSLNSLAKVSPDAIQEVLGKGRLFSESALPSASQ